MKKEYVSLVAGFGTLSDLITTKIGLRYPELVEMNPWANPLAEGACAVVLPLVVFKVADKLKVDPKVSAVCALGPALVPFVAAANNVMLIAQAQAKRYPWKECPFLYEGV